MKRHWSLLWSFVVLLLIPANWVQATDYTVKAGGGGNYTTIAACVNAMSSSGGDKCTVFAGTYNENPSIRAGTAGNYNVLTVNPGDTVTILGAAVNSHTKISGFTIQNPSNPFTSGCVNIPLGTTDAFITSNSMAYCGGPGATEDGMITAHDSGTSSGASFVYIQNNTLTHGCSAPGVNDVCESISINGDHYLIEGNDLSHNDDSIEFYASYVIARNNNFHDINENECSTSGHGSNCHPDLFESEPSNVTTHASQHAMFEKNTALNEFGTNAHAVLTQADVCGGQCFGAIIRFNSMAHVGSFGVIDDNAGNSSVPGFSYVKVYNNDFIDFLQGGGQDAVNGHQNNSTNGAEINNIFYFPAAIIVSPYYVDSSSSAGFRAASNDAYCTLTCSFLGRTTIGSFIADAIGNITSNPNFVNYAANNFHLAVGSPAIGTGTYLTTASGSGSNSTHLTVADAWFFQDGWGFPIGTGLGQVSPDWIRIGNSTTVQIAATGINYSTNTITLASPVSWNNGDPVYLYKDSTGTVVLNGANPDLGAFPFASSQPPPNPPTGLTATVQ